jgi:hypothetical protein
MEIRGKFLSILEVIDFDAHGLWARQGARFSRQGSSWKIARFLQSAEHGGAGKADLLAELVQGQDAWCSEVRLF